MRILLRVLPSLLPRLEGIFRLLVSVNNFEQIAPYTGISRIEGLLYSIKLEKEIAKAWLVGLGAQTLLQWRPSKVCASRSSKGYSMILRTSCADSVRIGSHNFGLKR